MLYDATKKSFLCPEGIGVVSLSQIDTKMAELAIKKCRWAHGKKNIHGHQYKAILENAYREVDKVEKYIRLSLGGKKSNTKTNIHCFSHASIPKNPPFSLGGHNYHTSQNKIKRGNTYRFRLAP